VNKDFGYLAVGVLRTLFGLTFEFEMTLILLLLAIKAPGPEYYWFDTKDLFL